MATFVEYQGDNDGNWIDGSCYVMSPYIMYDDMMNGIWYSSADGLEIGGKSTFQTVFKHILGKKVSLKYKILLIQMALSNYQTDKMFLHYIYKMDYNTKLVQYCQSLAYMLPIQ